MLKAVKKKEGPVFDSTNLRKEWDAATAVCRLKGLIVHDLRRSAIRNMMLSGAQQVEAMKISGHKSADAQRYAAR
jgi:integrase